MAELTVIARLAAAQGGRRFWFLSLGDSHEVTRRRFRRSRTCARMEARAIAAGPARLRGSGNGGTAQDERLRNVDITEPAALADFVEKEQIAFTLVGPEAPLAAGIVNLVRSRGLKIFGPTKEAAQLESSKDFAKAFMKRHAIPTAEYETFADVAAAHAYLDAKGAPIVIKADGPAAGKGVVVARDAGRSARRRRHDAVGQQARRRRRARRDRRVSGGRGSELHRDGRRQACAAARVEPGPQASARRRSGPEHRRHGRVLARAYRHAATARARDARNHPADSARHGEGRHPLHGFPVRRSDDRRARQSEDARVQLPHGRPGNAADHGAS